MISPNTRILIEKISRYGKVFDAENPHQPTNQPTHQPLYMRLASILNPQWPRKYIFSIIHNCGSPKKCTSLHMNNRDDPDYLHYYPIYIQVISFVCCTLTVTSNSNCPDITSLIVIPFHMFNGLMEIKSINQYSS